VPLLAGLGLGRFRSFSICDVCGSIEDETRIQLAYSSTTLFMSRTERQTPLSALVTGRGIVPPHTHQWIFGQGSGNGVRCALGPAHSLLGSTSAESAMFLRAVDDYRGRDEAVQWIAILLDGHRFPRAETLGRTSPPQVFGSREVFDAWWRENAFVISMILAGPDAQ
jgi:hypothetical protein